MTFLFDTGSVLPIDSDLANGLFTLLQPLVLTAGAAATARGPYVRTLRQLPFDLDEDVFEANWREAIGNLPALIVVIGDGEAMKRQPSVILWRYDIRVHCVSGVPGKWTDGRVNPLAGDERHDPGCAVIAQHVIEDLHGKTPAPPVKASSVSIERKTHGLTGPALSWYTVHGRVDVMQAIELQRGQPALAAVTVNQGIASAGTIVTTTKTYP